MNTICSQQQFPWNTYHIRKVYAVSSYLGFFWKVYFSPFPFSPALTLLFSHKLAFCYLYWTCWLAFLCTWWGLDWATPKPRVRFQVSLDKTGGLPGWEEIPGLSAPLSGPVKASYLSLALELGSLLLGFQGSHWIETFPLELRAFLPLLAPAGCPVLS